MINAKTKTEKRNIQNKLRLLRKGQGVTQEELAERIGCSRQALNKFEQGKTWSSEWEERYNIALGIERREPGELREEELPGAAQTLGGAAENEKGSSQAPGADDGGMEGVAEDSKGGDEA